MIVQYDAIAGLELARGAPLGREAPTRDFSNGEHFVIRREPQVKAFLGDQLHNRLAPSREETARAGGKRLAVHERVKRLAHEITHLARTYAGVDPGVRSDARIGRADRLAIIKIVPLVDAVDEDHAGLGVAVCGPHDLVPELARREHLEGRAAEF